MDIARLVMLCCETEVRRELESSILDYYYNEFSQLMSESGKKVEYNLEQVKLL